MQDILRLIHSITYLVLRSFITIFRTKQIKPTSTLVVTKTSEQPIIRLYFTFLIYIVYIDII